MIESIEKRIRELEISLIGIQNNANAHIGAIKELQRLRVEIMEKEKNKEEIKKTDE